MIGDGRRRGLPVVIGALTSACVILLATVADAQIAISVTGDIFKTIDAADLQAGAGSALYPTYESAADATLVSLSGTADPGDAWRVDVKRVDATWSAALALVIRRTGSGTGGSVSGGLVYLEILTADQTLFSGSGDVVGVPFQFKLSGMSIQVPAGTYSTAIWFTVVDT